MSDQAKELIFEEEARDFLRKGITELQNVVGVTLGPKGRHVGLDTSFGSPNITNDGNSIVADVELKNQFENMGASIGKEVASKMKEKCGDGTTTSILLLSALVDHGVKNIASGSSPIHVKRGMEKATDALLEALKKQATAVKSDTDIEEIATASASGSKEVGATIRAAFEKAGHSGVISIEEAQGTETTIEMVEGMQFDRGYTSAYFCTNAENLTCEMTRPNILITDQRISSIQEILPVVQAAAQSAQELLIIAEDVEGEALSTLVINRLKGTLKVCAVKAPGFGDRRKAMLQDIAALTGATLLSEETGSPLKDADSSSVGRAERVVITKDHTTIVDGAGTKETIEQRVQAIEAELDQTSSKYDKEKLEERKAKLSGGVAVIRVGATTESELKAKKQLFEDSLNSTRAALAEGVVVGGGVALLRAAKEVEKDLNLPKEEATGGRIALSACQAPFRTLVQNSGFDPSLYFEEVLAAKPHFGFNAASGQIEDLFKAGVRDPLKVVSHALTFSTSAAAIVLLSECLIGDAPEEDSKNR